MGAFAVPLALAGGSAAASGINTRNTARRQDRALATRIRNQAQHQQQADARIADTLGMLAASNPQADRANALEQYVSILRANRGGFDDLGGPGGRVPRAFVEASTQAMADAHAGNMLRADQLAVQEAAGRMRDREATAQMRLASDLGMLARAARGRAGLDDMRARSIQRNPWLDALSQAMGGMAMSGVGARAPTPTMAQATGWGAPLPAGVRQPVNFAPHLRFGGGGRP